MPLIRCATGSCAVSDTTDATDGCDDVRLRYGRLDSEDRRRAREEVEVLMDPAGSCCDRSVIGTAGCVSTDAGGDGSEPPPPGAVAAAVFICIPSQGISSAPNGCCSTGGVGGNIMPELGAPPNVIDVWRAGCCKSIDDEAPGHEAVGCWGSSFTSTVSAFMSCTHCCCCCCFSAAAISGHAMLVDVVDAAGLFSKDKQDAGSSGSIDEVWSSGNSGWSIMPSKPEGAVEEFIKFCHISSFAGLESSMLDWPIACATATATSRGSELVSEFMAANMGLCFFLFR